MTADETHDDFTPTDTYEFVCTNRDCEHSRQAVELPVQSGTETLLDSNDMDCECGAERVPFNNGIEWVDPEIQRRYLDVQAVRV